MEPRVEKKGKYFLNKVNDAKPSYKDILRTELSKNIDLLHIKTL